MFCAPLGVFSDYVSFAPQINGKGEAGEQEAVTSVRTIYFTHESSFAHEMGPGHPECPQRLRAIDQALTSQRFQWLDRHKAPPAAREDVARVHPEAFLDALAAASPREGYVLLEADAAINPKTMEAALFAAGGAVAAVDAVMTREAETAFVAARPPGHHAGVASPMGFCFLNNVAIAAKAAIAKHGAERVAIVDFDVHHGNGTQEIFWSDRQVLFCSTHQAPFYPGTGGLNERGEHDTIVNAPLPAGADGYLFAQAFSEVIAPRIKAFAPDLIFDPWDRRACAGPAGRLEAHDARLQRGDQTPARSLPTSSAIAGSCRCSKAVTYQRWRIGRRACGGADGRG